MLNRTSNFATPRRMSAWINTCNFDKETTYEQLSAHINSLNTNQSKTRPFIQLAHTFPCELSTGLNATTIEPEDLHHHVRLNLFPAHVDSPWSETAHPMRSILSNHDPPDFTQHVRYTSVKLGAPPSVRFPYLYLTSTFTTARMQSLFQPIHRPQPAVID